MKFIPIEKMSKLREAAKSGDEHARKILDMQMSGGDFSSLLDEYFQPKPEVDMKAQTVETKSMPQKKSKLEEFLEFNNVTKDSPDYNSFVEDFYAEFPNEKPGMVENPVEQIEDDKDGFDSIIRDLMKDETDAIEEYSKAITKIMTSEELDESKKRRIIARFKEIRSDEEEHFRELGELLKNDEPKEETL